jgi:hypothetical protein
MRAPHLHAWVCVSKLWVVHNDVSTSIVAACEFESEGLGQVKLQAGVCGQGVAVP